MLKVVNTLYTIKEMKTDGHAPVLFHCSDGYNYFCKYRIWPKPKEINCLAFEVIASVLLKELNIPTPQIALVRVDKGSINRKKLRKNLKLKEGMVIFGSREINPVNLVDGFSTVRSRTDFKKLSNPDDIIGIALFDLWVKNADRGRALTSDYNYNLLFTMKNGKKQILAFDHAFIFKEGRTIGNFYPNVTVMNGSHLFQTFFYRSIIHYYDDVEYNRIVDKFVALLSRDYSEIIGKIIAQLPSSWDLLEDLGGRITQLLNNQSRTEKLANLLKNVKL